MVEESDCCTGKYISGFTGASRPQCFTSAITPTTSIQLSMPASLMRRPTGEVPGQ
jgi:hypothetical protein